MDNKKLRKNIKRVTLVLDLIALGLLIKQMREDERK